MGRKSLERELFQLAAAALSGVRPVKFQGLLTIRALRIETIRAPTVSFGQNAGKEAKFIPKPANSKVGDMPFAVNLIAFVRGDA